MEFKSALTDQLRAGLAMLQQCVERCPDDIWSAVVDKPPRTFWRIAYHATFYSHFYLSQTADDFIPWDKHVRHAVITFVEDDAELPPDGVVYSKSDLLEYIDFVNERSSALIDSLDLDSRESGFPWYPGVPKINHVLLTLRHLGVHVGQLQELLYARGIETDWL